MACKTKFRDAARDLVVWMEEAERGGTTPGMARPGLDPRLLALGALVGAGLGTVVTVASAALT